MVKIRQHTMQAHSCSLRLRFVIFTLVISACIAIPSPTHAAPLGPAFLEERRLPLFSDEVAGGYVCSANLIKREPSRCPPYGPGARQVRLEYLRARLPDPLPELAIEEIEVPDGAITPYTFAYVRSLPAATYRHPEEANADLPPVREFYAGDNWVSVMGSVDYNGEIWYEINPDEFIREQHLAFTRPSYFRGVLLSAQPEYAFGWINRDVYASSIPGGPQREDVLLQRYDRITMFAQEPMGDQLWYMVGPDQWVEQSYTSRVDVDPRPDRVGPDERWIEINTYEQTLAAYEGDRMVFATLMSSGRSSTWTPNGLTRIWGKYPTTPMRNQDVDPENPAWYYLEDVEWTQYFNGAYALHAAYWHNSFAFPRSHGCVNLSISDAKWLFEWTTPHTPTDANVVYSSDADPGTWVWVHMTAPASNVVAAQ
ncbi:MAG: L,D-transpeptidase [Anaerolineae bacterium]